MIQKIKKSLAITMSLIAMLAPSLFLVAAPVAVSADITTKVCEGADEAAGTSGCNTGGIDGAETGIKKLAKNIVNIFSIVIGVIAIIFILYGGFKYITSGGDSNNVSAAKNTIIYAIIGLVIVALAQVIVHYVLNTASELTTT